ncbi:DUF2897 family protein [Thalassotalea atypica]|uniref:DUF2897 family protein n=1 Tax=Thalassotalea atypica TaxID=2054316 RepID=UPI0025736AE6|nr:DUF2897 family protein [Thalassotalea atypica]
MNFWVIAICAIALGLIVGGILLLKQSAKKFKLTEQQLEEINQRNKELDAIEEQEK